MSRPKARKNLRSVFQWHRYVGLTAFLFVITLAVTGIMLNHTDNLDLDEIYIKSSLLLDWYGIAPPHIDTAYATANHSIIQIEDRLYLDQHPLDGLISRLRGAVEAAGIIAIAADSAVLLLTPEGDLIEKLDHAEGVPPALRAIGQTQDGRVVLRTTSGLYTTDQNFLTWPPYQNRSDRPIRWSQPRLPPPVLVQTLQQQYRSHILPVERVMLDVHSGRILGTWGFFVMDASAVLLCFLGFSGCWLWYERYRKRKAHERKWPRP